MAKRCCCVIPLRGGSALIGLIVALVSVLLLGLTFTKKNPMIMHLAIINPALPWVYVIVIAASAVVGLYGVLAGTVGKLALMRLYKLLFWLLFFVVCIWQAVDFVLSLVYRSQSIAECQKSSGTTSTGGAGNNTEISVGGYTTTFLGMEMGNTYGLANCDQAAQAGVIGLAIMLFIGGLFMFYFGTVISAYTRRLRERNLGHRLRDDEWDSNLDELSAAYRADARNAPKYPLQPLNKKKKSGIMGKLKFGKK
ncbi:uncharacterized protein BX664DRAFT_334282 [Halteromyces radiatus]|uniref:uncharacterized protein n=1 Tax=Halteromyces radiatus TaxID=101107 RepID=UPI00221E7230|nr:uncharacterized protein BX664DRAFT_334282 [Halteromyces radiatus]KAI8089942.1 hypothetical protein BX664DRAFT_334282 [Halteromyces radiatus]